MPHAKRTPDIHSRTANRVLLLVTQADWGGVQSFLVRFAKDLKAEGREVLLAAGGDGELWQEAERAGIRTHRLKHVARDITPIEDIRAVFEIKRLIDDFKPDAIHLNSSKMGVVGGLASARSKTKPWTVYRIGGWSFLEPISPMKQSIYRVSEQLSARWKDVIVTVHPGDQELAERLGIRPRYWLTTVPNGLDVVNFVSRLKTKEAARSALGIPDGAFVFGTVANAYATKGLLPYLDALAKTLHEDKHAAGVIIGDGPELEALKRKRDDLDVRDRIILAGHRDDAASLYPAFDVFVLPSRKEGMPWTLLEAMAAGIPSIATDVGACRWMLTGSSSGDAGLIVPPNDALSLVEAMRRLRTQKTERDALSHAARLSVQNRFSWDETSSGNRDALDRMRPA
jgi:glycosyltransferase involved in cell wall biosynthesis